MSEQVITPIEEFSNTLDALLSVKPPGVSGSKIKKLTELAIENVQVLSFFFFRSYKIIILN